MDDIAMMLGEKSELLAPTPGEETETGSSIAHPKGLKVVVGMTGASGAIFAVDFLKRCPGSKYLIASKWARAVIHTELGYRASELDPYVVRRFSDDDLAAPIASGSNAFDAVVILPCTVSTAAKIAAGIGDTLITRTAQVALKERRRLVLAIRETPLSTVVLEALHKLSQDGVVIFPLSPPWYGNPLSLQELVTATTNKLLSLIGVDVPGGWREKDME